MLEVKEDDDVYVDSPASTSLEQRRVARQP